MADETTMTPVEGAEPPKANPLAKPASSNSSTLTLKPLPKPGNPTASGLKLPPKPGLASGLKLPPKPGLASGLKLPPKPGTPTQSGLKLPPKPGLASGLKLPPKPGLPTQSGLKLPPKPGLASGLKLPPKPGATQTGLKVPPKPGATTQAGLATKGLATQTGTALPTRPIIHKPGSTLAGLKKPTLLGATKPAVVATASAATVVKPVTAATATAEPVADLQPVTPTEAGSAKPEVKSQTAALDALKDATQNLKSLTAPIPQQAILRKTGMLAEEKSDGQAQAAKAKTSRISLSEAMGAAPVQNENAPMKTIRIKRPIDIPGVTKPTVDTEAKTVAAPSATEAKTVPSSVSSAAAAAVDPSEAKTVPINLTQRKTLKISRPSSGAMRPSGKFGIKRPGTMVTSKPSAAKPAEDGADAKAPAEGDVPEIADIPSLPTAAAPKPVVPGEKELPKGFSITSIIIQIAACGAMGALAWWLYTDTQILPF